MKILWHSNAAWSPTGYGQQTALFAPRVQREHDLAISAFYGLEGSRLQWEGITVYPGLGQTYGDEVIEGHARAHFGELRGGLVVTLMDVWVLKPDLWRKLNIASWVPVDHDPVPPMVHQFFTKTGAVPIAMSRFGERMLADFDPLYCPHGVDSALYRPQDRREARKLAGLPRDAFVVGVVAANKGQPSRKCFPEILQAFAALRQRHPEALLYLHTEITGRHDGVSIPMIAASLGLPSESIAYADQYRLQFNPLPANLMSYVYSSMDVLLNPSRGEGFGVPVLEAQACGVPAIVTDFSAMSEVCGVGWKCEALPEWSGQLAWQVRPKLDAIVDSLEQAFARPKALIEQMALDARKHALTYDADHVLREYMLPALEAAAERFGERVPLELVAA